MIGGIIINKKEITEEQFKILINSEKVAYHVYDNIIRKELKDQNVDVIAQIYCEFSDSLCEKIEIIASVLRILKNDYKVDIESLPFKYEELGLMVKRNNLIHDLQDYFNNKKIKYNQDDVFITAQKFKTNDQYVEKMVSEIDELTKKMLECYGYNIKI